MVKKRHSVATSPTAKKKPARPLERVTYTPPATYALDIEIIPIRELRTRVIENRFRQAHQINFYLMMLVTRGKCEPTVDYTPVQCRKGSLILVSPNQALQFDMNEGWQGWITIFRPEYLAAVNDDAVGGVLLPEAMQGIPACVRLTASSQQLFAASLEQMYVDTRTLQQQPVTNALLRFQLKALLLRILMQNDQTVVGEPDPAHLSRFRRFRRLVEEKFAHQHKAADYAAQLGCTVKSLSRASLASAAVGAKEYISGRINLEAKRLLTHTQMPISAIAEQLGFDEPTNFIKFFKRGCGLAPSEFRKLNYSIYN